jgi:hypothetical protein
VQGAGCKVQGAGFEVKEGIATSSCRTAGLMVHLSTTHRHKIMNNGSHSGHFRPDSEIWEFYFLVKMPEVDGIGAHVHDFISLVRQQL